MSFINDILGAVGGAVEWLGGNSIGAGLARTAITGYALRKVTNSIQKENAKPETTQPSQNPVLNPIPDAGVRLQIAPDPENRIPVVYGSAHLGGIITDAELANGNQDLYVVFTLCERTGRRLSDNAQSIISFENIFVNDERMVFNVDGETLTYTIDRDGNLNNNWAGLIDVYCYNNGSTGGVKPVGYTGQPTVAYSVMPSWSPLYTMNELVFAIVRIRYSPDRGLQSIPTFRFQLNNSMTQPGDCVFDYMTNTRYGAGIAPSEIRSE
jgi:hypothetical protein